MCVGVRSERVRREREEERRKEREKLISGVCVCVGYMCSLRKLWEKQNKTKTPDSN